MQEVGGASGIGAELGEDPPATHYLGVIAVIRAASRVLRTGGRIITVSSGLGSQVGAPGLADYSATKSGIERYTMGVARDLGARNITANVVEAGSGPYALSRVVGGARPEGTMSFRLCAVCCDGASSTR